MNCFIVLFIFGTLFSFVNINFERLYGNQSKFVKYLLGGGCVRIILD